MEVNSFIFLSFLHRHLGFVCRARTGLMSLRKAQFRLQAPLEASFKLKSSNFSKSPPDTFTYPSSSPEQPFFGTQYCRFDPSLL